MKKKKIKRKHHKNGVNVCLATRRAFVRQNVRIILARAATPDPDGEDDISPDALSGAGSCADDSDEDQLQGSARDDASNAP